MSRYKVVTDSGEFVSAGRASDDGYAGLDEKDAISTASRRNEKAEKLGIQTRYKVVSLDE